MNWLPVDSMRYSLVIMEREHIPVYGELLFREATSHETLLRPFFMLLIPNGLVVLARHSCIFARPLVSPLSHASKSLT